MKRKRVKKKLNLADLLEPSFQRAFKSVFDIIGTEYTYEIVRPKGENKNGNQN